MISVAADEMGPPVAAVDRPLARIVICDDQDHVRLAIVQTLAGVPDVTVVGQTGDGSSCIDLLRSTVPDIVILDLNLPGGGPELARAAAAAAPGVSVIVFTARDDQLARDAVLVGGAVEFVVKTGRAKPLLDAVRRVIDARDLTSLPSGRLGRVDDPLPQG